MEAVLKVVRYIKTEPGIGVLMSSKKEKDLIAFCDANIGSMPKSKNISDMILNQAWGVFDFMEVEEINNRVNNFSGTRV